MDPTQSAVAVCLWESIRLQPRHELPHRRVSHAQSGTMSCGTFAQVLTEVCHNVATEPTLEPLQGESFRLASTSTADGARLDIAASGFWGGRFERTFFDIQVCNPLVQSNAPSRIQSVYHRYEHQKRRKYEERIREVERASFCPLIFSTSGGAGPAAAF